MTRAYSDSWSAQVPPLYVAPGVSSVSYPTGSASSALTATKGSDGKWYINARTYTNHICEKPSHLIGVQWSDVSVTITQSVPVTVQNHYYELEASSSSVTFDAAFSSVEQDDKLGLLSLLGLTLKDWNNPVSAASSASAVSVASVTNDVMIANDVRASSSPDSDLSFTITQDGVDKSDDFYAGKLGNYQVSASVVSSSDPEDTPRGRSAESGQLSVRVMNSVEEAKAEIEAKRADVKNKLASPNLPDVTDAQRDALLKKADDEAEKAVKNIEAASSTAEVTTAKTDGIAALEKILPEGELTDKREAAKKQVDNSASEATSQVEALSKLTEAERKAFSDRIDQEAQTGKTAIDEANVDQVDAKKVEAQNKIAEIVAEAKKQVYKDEVNKRRDEVIAAINAQSDLDSAAKEALVKEATDKAAQACTNIDNAGSSGTAIEGAKDAGIKALDAVNLDAGKQNAVAKLDKDAASAREQIAQLKNLTDQERAQAEVDIATKLDDAKDKVNAAATVDAAVSAQAQGSKDLADVVQLCKDFDAKNLKAAKEDSVAALRKRAEELTGQVDAEWTSLKDPDGVKAGINAILKQYIDAINKENDVEDLPAVADLLGKGLTALEQAGAKAEIEDYAAKAKAEVNAHAELTKKQKQDYAQKVDAEADKAIAKTTGTVDKAANALEAAKARDEAKHSIDRITVDAARAQGNAVVQAKADAAKRAIDALQNLSDPDENGKSAAEQKQEAKNAIDQAVATAQTAIAGFVSAFNAGDGTTPSAANTKSDINAASQTAFSTIEGLLDGLSAKDRANLDKAIEQANKDLDTKAEQAKQQIDALPDLSEEDKTKAKADIDSIVSSAKKEIASKESITQVNEAIAKAETAISNRVSQAELNDAKAAARKALEAKAAEIDEQIDAKTYLSDADKQKLDDEVAATLEEHLANVDAAEDIAGVDAAKQAGLDALDAIGVEADSEDEQARQQQVDEAKSALDAKAEEAKQLVDELLNVDQATKDQAKAQIDQARDEAKAKVEAAGSTSEIESEQKVGCEAIDSIVNALAEQDKANLDDAKAAAIKELEAKAAEVDKLIDAKQYLSEAQKRELHERVAATLGEYVAKVNAAESVEEVSEAKQAGLEALEAIGAQATRLDEEAAAERAKAEAARAKAAASLAATGSAVMAPALAVVFAVLPGAGLALSRRRARR